MDQPKKKVNRAKARLQRRADNMEAQRQEAAAEAANMPDLKALEKTQMSSKLESLKLIEHDINADGHCLYSAFADQLAARCQRQESHQSLRVKAAEYIRNHAEDFEPFLATSEADVPPTIESYTKEIETTPRWGGEMEIIALARDLGVAVDVVQANANTLHFEEGNSQILSLARYQHMYSLGAHFNSLRTKE